MLQVPIVCNTSKIFATKLFSLGLAALMLSLLLLLLLLPLLPMPLPLLTTYVGTDIVVCNVFVGDCLHAKDTCLLLPDVTLKWSGIFDTILYTDPYLLLFCTSFTQCTMQHIINTVSHTI